ncbi:ATP-binding protein [Cecembia lonarensis]|uniref:histidine kinase n=1 Tax=Cecembia lonarensis (strain CCUG 58316 / KCTC 22772 / LW9) TaxID=1225176 RepID=K1LXH1_CECL9|nr:ATP-binding protein [Cecembia lonarensis]EKB48894.1 Histidine protein kinase divJ [Cecembia lonarensis LW9]
MIYLNLLVAFFFVQMEVNNFNVINHIGGQRNAVIDSLNIWARDMAYLDPEQAIDAAYLALEKSRLLGYDRGIAYASRNIAAIVHFQSNYLIGMDYLTNAVRIFEVLGDSTGIADTHISFGHVFNRMDTLELSLFYHQSAYDFYKNRGEKERLMVTMLNLGEVYLKAGQLEDAGQILHEGYQLCLEKNNQRFKSSFAMNLGLYYWLFEDKNMADRYFQESLSIANQYGDNVNKLTLAMLTLEYAKFKLELGHFAGAEELLLRSLDVSNRYNLDFVAEEAYHVLLGLYLKENSIQEAQSLLQTFKSFQDKLASRNAVLSRQFTFNFLENRDMQVNLAEIENRFAQANTELKKSNQVLLLLSLLFLLLIVMLVLGGKMLKKYNYKQGQLKRIFDFLSSGIFLLDADYRILEVNEFAIQIIGNPLKEKEDFYQLFNFKDKNGLWEKFKLGEVISLPYRSLQGQDYELSIQSKRVQILGEKFFLVFLYDDTLKVRFRNQKKELDELLQKIYDSAGIGLFEIEINKEGMLHIHQYSAFFNKVLQINPGDSIAANQLEKLISSFDGDKFVKLMRKNASEQDFLETDLEFTSFRQEKVWLKVIAKANRKPNGNLIVRGLGEDITSQKILTLDLENNLIKEKELNELKTQFIYTASHEFKNPLSAILSSSEILKLYVERGIAEAYKDKAKVHFEKIGNHVNRINKIMDDILLLEKYNEGKLEANYEHFCLKGFFRTLFDDICLMNKLENSVDFSVPEKGLEVCMDKNLLYYVMINLVSNALKYTPRDRPNPQVHIQLEDALLKITVQDFGLGIPKEDQQHLFKSFFRAKNVKNIKGTGLGLKIVSNFVDLMGGNIRFESEEGVGTTFVVEIPIKVESHGRNSVVLLEE